VRRAATIAIGIVAVLASSCGEAAMPPRLATTLENRVATIRGLAEDGRPGLAIAATRDLMSLVTDRLHAGKIDDSKAVEILEAARALVDDLELMARPAAESPSPSAIPSEEDEGGDGDKGKGKGKGKGHDEEGDGNEGQGNDED
jgi:hypothetical protein